MVDRGTAASGPDRPSPATERHVAHLVHRLAPLTAPDGPAKDRMRQRILTSLATPDSGSRTAGSRTAGTERPPNAPRGSTGPRRPVTGGTRPGHLSHAMRGARGRFAVAAIALLALVFSLAGMSLLLARDALPGDALYGIKRTAEAASLGLTFGDESKALKHLEFASARVTEIETLAQRYANPADAPVGGYLTALSDFDNDAAAGSRQLIALATRNDGRQLESLRAWAGQQNDRLGVVTGRLPGAARNRQGTSLALLSKIETRADALLARMQCYQITTGSYDDVGALPANGICERVPGADVPPVSAGQSTDAGRIATPGAPGAPGVTSVPVAPLPPPAPPGTLPTGTLPTGQLPTGTLPINPTSAPAGSTPRASTPGTSAPTVTIPLPLPTVEVPPPLPGLPGIRVGG
jgi:Domain of unknown function (DUF5667)